MKELLFAILLVVVGITNMCEGGLFAANKISNYGSDPLRVGAQVGSINLQSGNFAPIATTLVLQAGGFIYSQASTFDQVNQIFYYYGTGPFIYGVNVATGQLVAPVFFSPIMLTNGLAWTALNNQLYIFGTTSTASAVIYSYPANGPAVGLVNLTSIGLPPFTPAFLTADPIKGNGYVLFNNNPSQGLINLITFSPTGSVNLTLLGCKIQFFSPAKIFYDPITSKLIGVGRTGSTAIYFEQTSDGTCNYKSFNAGDTIADVAYDPTTSTIYVYGSYDGTTSHLYTWVTTSTTSTSIPVVPDLVNLIASYKV